MTLFSRLVPPSLSCAVPADAQVDSPQELNATATLVVPSEALPDVGPPPELLDAEGILRVHWPFSDGRIIGRARKVPGPFKTHDMLLDGEGKDGDGGIVTMPFAGVVLWLMSLGARVVRGDIVALVQPDMPPATPRVHQAPEAIAVLLRTPELRHIGEAVLRDMADAPHTPRRGFKRHKVREIVLPPPEVVPEPEPPKALPFSLAGDTKPHGVRGTESVWEAFKKFEQRVALKKQGDRFAFLLSLALELDDEQLAARVGEFRELAGIPSMAEKDRAA